jgi:hypothetical protein
LGIWRVPLDAVDGVGDRARILSMAYLTSRLSQAQAQAQTQARTQAQPKSGQAWLGCAPGTDAYSSAPGGRSRTSMRAASGPRAARARRTVDSAAGEHR